MDRVLEQYRDSRFCREIIEAYNPLAIFVTGSRAVGIHTDISDYDICLLVDVEGKPDASYPDNSLQYIHKETGLCLHYYTRGIDELFTNKEKGREVNVEDNYLWKALIGFNFDNSTIYVRDDFAESWREMIDARNVISKAAEYELYTEYGLSKYLFDRAYEGDIYPHKDVVYAIAEYYVLKGMDIEEETLARFREIRTMNADQIESLPEEEKSAYIEKLKGVANMFRSGRTEFEKYKMQADAIYNNIKARI